MDAVHANLTLDKGKWVEFVTSKDFVAQGSGRFVLVQYMVGQNYSNLQPGKGAPGDPAMALAVPVEQYRSSYQFLAPTTYQQNYVNILSRSTAIRMDGKPLAASLFVAIGTTGFYVARVKINGGSHQVDAKEPFGILVYGVGAYTSYMYPGGLNLSPL